MPRTQLQRSAALPAGLAGFGPGSAEDDPALLAYTQARRVQSGANAEMKVDALVAAGEMVPDASLKAQAELFGDQSLTLLRKGGRGSALRTVMGLAGVYPRVIHAHKSAGEDLGAVHGVGGSAAIRRRRSGTGYPGRYLTEARWRHSDTARAVT